MLVLTLFLVLEVEFIVDVFCFIVNWEWISCCALHTVLCWGCCMSVCC